MALSNRTPVRLAHAVRALLYTERCPHCDHPGNEPANVATAQDTTEVATYTCRRCDTEWSTTWHQYWKRA